MLQVLPFVNSTRLPPLSWESVAIVSIVVSILCVRYFKVAQKGMSLESRGIKLKVDPRNLSSPSETWKPKPVAAIEILEPRPWPLNDTPRVQVLNYPVLSKIVTYVTTLLDPST